MDSPVCWHSVASRIIYLIGNLPPRANLPCRAGEWHLDVIRHLQVYRFNIDSPRIICIAAETVRDAELRDCRSR
jgi:hypothetical protein